VAAAYRQLGVRTILATPLLREGNSIGVILVRRTTVRPFTDQQIALLKTFADQAVIAIENVRLLKELEAKNSDLTATSEILRVISASPTDVQPVFETIVRNASMVCGAFDAAVFIRRSTWRPIRVPFRPTRSGRPSRCQWRRSPVTQS
jgi:two-component system, NtrC family, sensor kinase